MEDSVRAGTRVSVSTNMSTIESEGTGVDLGVSSRAPTSLSAATYMVQRNTTKDVMKSVPAYMSVAESTTLSTAGSAGVREL